jgi:hypothetical protein
VKYLLPGHGPWTGNGKRHIELAAQVFGSFWFKWNTWEFIKADVNENLSKCYNDTKYCNIIKKLNLIKII